MMKGFVAYLLILKITLCHGQFEKNICIGDVEIAFSTEENYFDEARKSCQNFGGDLVKIGSADIQNIINSTLEKSNQPNIADENCVALGIHRVYAWTDTSCRSGNRRRYICQRDFLITIRNTGDSTTCQSPSSTVGVRWEKNSALVESLPKSGVYQKIDTNNAYLNHANANITEAGTYTCATTNTSCSATKTFTISTDGSPTIQSTDNTTCNASLFVTWKPNKAAVGFIHRFRANGTIITDVIPNSIDFRTTEITGLKIATNYIVQIQVCESDNLCTTSFITKSDGTTDGVIDPSATVATGEACKVTKSSFNQDTTTNIGLIIGLVVGLIALLIAIVAGIVIVRRRQTCMPNSSKSTKNVENGNTLVMSEVQNTSPYENEELRPQYEEIKNSERKPTAQRNPQGQPELNILAQTHFGNRPSIAQKDEKSHYEEPILHIENNDQSDNQAIQATNAQPVSNKTMETAQGKDQDAYSYTLYDKTSPTYDVLTDAENQKNQKVEDPYGYENMPSSSTYEEIKN